MSSAPPDYLERILNAQVYDVAIESPLDFAANLSGRIGNRIYLKREDLQPVFSFKLRGAYNKLSKLPPELLARGVICASAGNHAQGLALSAQKMGVRAVIVMPTTTPLIKVDAVRRRGGEVVLAGESYTDAYAHAKALKRGALRGGVCGYLCWHFTVQDDVVIQHIPTNERGEHADFDGPGNRYSIGIEMCEHKGNDLAKTIDRTAELAAWAPSGRVGKVRTGPDDRVVEAVLEPLADVGGLDLDLAGCTFAEAVARIGELLGAHVWIAEEADRDGRVDHTLFFTATEHRDKTGTVVRLVSGADGEGGVTTLFAFDEVMAEAPLAARA